jgi:hypothetical protein
MGNLYERLTSIISLFTAVILIFITAIYVNLKKEIKKNPEYIRFYEYNVFHHSYYDVTTQEVHYQDDTIAIDTLIIKLK